MDGWGSNDVTRKEQRDQFHNGARAAWNHYQATGIHITSEEADTWLAELEIGEDAEAASPSPLLN